MDLHLEPTEAELLRHILTRYLSDLRPEIYKTERYALRQELKRDEATIKTLIARLNELGVAAE